MDKLRAFIRDLMASTSSCFVSLESAADVMMATGWNKLLPVSRVGLISDEANFQRSWATLLVDAAVRGGERTGCDLEGWEDLT